VGEHLGLHQVLKIIASCHQAGKGSTTGKKGLAQPKRSNWGCPRRGSGVTGYLAITKFEH